jgi:hypothetical protein
MNCVSLPWIAGARKASHALVALLLVGSACDGDKDSKSSDTDSKTTEAVETTSDDTSEPTSTDGTTDTTDTTDTTESPTTTETAEVDYAADVQPIWDANCTTGCHVSGGSASTWFLITPDASYNALVGKNSVSFPSLVLVTPGSRDDSYLWHKINGTHFDVGGGGAAMPPPPDGQMLSAGDLATIGAWIDQGANP